MDGSVIFPDPSVGTLPCCASLSITKEGCFSPTMVLAHVMEACVARRRRCWITIYLDWIEHPNTKGLGPLSVTSHQGLPARTTLARASERVPLGLLQQQVWARDKELPRNQDHKQRPTCEKESQKWLTSLDALIAARAACPTTRFVSVGDREADVYDLFLVGRPRGVDLLVRAAQDRKVEQEERYLWAAMASAPLAATLTLHLGKRGQQLARQATVSVHCRDDARPDSDIDMLMVAESDPSCTRALLAHPRPRVLSEGGASSGRLPHP